MKYLSKDGLTYLWKKIKAEDTKLVNRIYPVGAIYLTYNNNNPSTFIGGTWERFGQGRVLVGEGTGNDGSASKTFSAGSSGGEYSHKLTIDEMPAHNHSWKLAYGNTDPANGFQYATTKTGTFQDSANFIGKTGNDVSHNNIQPYITVYFWKRTA